MPGITIDGGVTLQYGNVTAATRTQIVTSAVGNVSVSTAQFKIGNAALLTNSDNSYVKCNASGSLLVLGASPVTIEGWHYPVSKPSGFPTTISNFNYADGGTNSGNDWCIQWSRNNGANKFAFCLNNVTQADAWLFSTNTFTANNWYHVAIVRNVNTWTMYINGNQEAQGTFAGSLDGGATKNIYTNQNGAGGAVWYNGYIDELRVSNIARYTANFTPQLTPFVNDANTKLLLHCDGANNSTSFPDDNTGTTAGGLTITY
jgi:hypothetical protein